MKKRALFLFADGVEELELIAPVDLLRRAGVEVTMASLGEDTHVHTRGGITLHADAMFDQVNPLDFDMLVLPGGPGVVALRQTGLIATACCCTMPDCSKRYATRVTTVVGLSCLDRLLTKLL